MFDRKWSHSLSNSRRIVTLSGMGESVKHFKWLVILCVLLSFACAFGKSEPPQIVGMKDGKVLLRKRQPYSVGFLPSGWTRFATKTPAIAFHHEEYQSTIFTWAQCGRQYEDVPHHALAERLLGGVEQPQTLTSQSLQLAQRAAFLKRIRGSVDGVEVEVASVVVKKDDCCFDFVLIEPSPNKSATAMADFQTFYSGFAY